VPLRPNGLRPTPGFAGSPSQPIKDAGTPGTRGGFRPRPFNMRGFAPHPCGNPN